MKKYLFGLLAIVFAISAVAFTHPAKKTNGSTWEYRGDITANQIRDAVYYFNVDEGSVVTCGGDPDLVCRITNVAAGTATHPDFSSSGSNGNPYDNENLFTVSKRELP